MGVKWRLLETKPYNNKSNNKTNIDQSVYKYKT